MSRITKTQILKLVHDEADFALNGDFHNDSTRKERRIIVNESLEMIKRLTKEAITGEFSTYTKDRVECNLRG